MIDLELIYNYYSYTLNETKDEIKKLKKIYIRIAEHVIKGLDTDCFKESLSSTRQELSKLNLKLMESFLRFNGDYKGLSDKQMKSIKEYREVFDEASSLTLLTDYNINRAIESLKNSNDIVVDSDDALYLN